MATDAQSAAFLAHIASQMQLNIAFLESQNYISSDDAAAMNSIMSKLPVSVSSHSVVRQYNIQVMPTAVVHSSSAPKTVTSARSVPPAPARQTVYARAMWAYNEDGSESNDLSFSSGELIEIVSEQNEDWWLGRARGKEALFPSNHVEKVDASAHTPASIQPAPATEPRTTKVYRPFGAALHGTDTPPSAADGVNSVGLQQASGQTEKKSKYGKFGNTMAHSAAGGVGFGAGAAIGGGLVRAIF
ncbi:hypothetical protein SERLA73DRAFT_181826 [Serpula lacrymans var. lacrymans S7.3]|uniref:SH3 domain-containing protein n=2 Tax=Serpula lacrymans var. lacrymans TaxID=341189 RepID=F8PYT1_SERL3|nr:uncharacterized protein SERLADRAFT_468198 [Serpula lacrymans var. lacrymans S7.9]EGN99044.1 hypothetical protein SERLA73DRAFT_181826 [Serpula lacrymans var. lacrymans S7.3]EGO24619.1 hypothetical protein SERLADRAFT_468198 [Serpula lacrymans var. lacrymans S7.9]